MTDLEDIIFEYSWSKKFQDIDIVEDYFGGNEATRVNDITFKSHTALFNTILGKTKEKVVFFKINLVPDGSIDYEWFYNTYRLLININENSVGWYGYDYKPDKENPYTNVVEKSQKYTTSLREINKLINWINKNLTQKS